MEIGMIRKIDIDQEMQQAYLDYAMSVIVSRALPDARDGLKPVHRRILFAMHEMGLRPSTAYKKSARVVGEVLGKYHPHSDTAVYDAMARMAQDFSMRYPLVDGQGNFGSVDGDPPAAMRYTEARMADPAGDIMADIQKDTVDYSPNFDSSMEEPTVLPSAIPNLLVNGSSGIAVGMATNIPPHNLSEVVDALVYILENWKKLETISIEDLMQFIKGPDFPTGGVIIGGLREDGLSAAYGTGRGRLVVQARTQIEDMGRGRERIIVTDLPYMTNKASLIERIAKLARAGSLTGISDLRDESDRQGMRIVIELSKNAEPEKVLASLYKRTPMQSTFGIIMLALVDNEPRLLSLKQALMVFIEHRLEIVKRRSEYDLKRALGRSHILEGLRIALKNLDEVITLIRKSADGDNARQKLMARFKLSDLQANAILDMPLRRLAALERKKIDLEYKEVQKVIKKLEGLLNSPLKMRRTVSQELLEIKEKYGDRRRTQIVQAKAGATNLSMLTASDLIPDSPTWVVISQKGLISRIPDGKPPRPSGKAAPLHQLRGRTRDTLYIVAENGQTSSVVLHAVPETESPDQGVPISSISALSDNASVAAIFSLPPKQERAAGWNIVSATETGMVKKTAVEDLPGPSAQSFQIAKVKSGDKLGWVDLSPGKSEILMATKNGMAIRFSEESVRPMGLAAVGVSGIKLSGEDQVVGMVVVDKEWEVFMFASDGRAKRVRVAQFPVQGRYGKGVLAWKLIAEDKLVGIAHGKPNIKMSVHFARMAAKSLRIDDAPVGSRQAKGKKLLSFKDNDRITSLSIPWEASGKFIKNAKSAPNGSSSSKPKQMKLMEKNTSPKKESAGAKSRKQKTRSKPTSKSTKKGSSQKKK